MPKNRRFRKGELFKKKRTPGGQYTYVRRKQRASKPKCMICKRPLLGTQQQGAKTQKRPERPYGGRLCLQCLEVAIERSIHLST